MDKIADLSCGRNFNNCNVKTDSKSRRKSIWSRPLVLERKKLIAKIKELKALKVKYQRQTEYIKILQSNIKLSPVDKISGAAGSELKMAWEQELLVKAFGLFSISQRAYEYTRLVLKHPLPDSTTLLRWAPQDNIAESLQNHVVTRKIDTSDYNNFIDVSTTTSKPTKIKTESFTENLTGNDDDDSIEELKNNKPYTDPIFIKEEYCNTDVHISDKNLFPFIDEAVSGQIYEQDSSSNYTNTRLITTTRGRKKLVDDKNYIYAENRQNANGTKTYWQCEIVGCRARLHTANGERIDIIKRVGKHHHGTSPTKTKARQTLNDLKARALSTNESPRSLIANMIANLDESERAQLPSDSSIGRTIRKWRQYNAAAHILGSSLIMRHAI